MRWNVVRTPRSGTSEPMQAATSGPAADASDRRDAPWLTAVRGSRRTESPTTAPLPVGAFVHHRCVRRLSHTRAQSKLDPERLAEWTKGNPTRCGLCARRRPVELGPERPR
jgi:hypothetical protein